MQLIRRILRAQAGEERAVALAFGYFFMLMCSYYLLRPLRDAMAIEAGLENLPWLYVGTFAATLVLSPGAFVPCAVIPVYNHEHAVGRVVDAVRAAGLPCVLVDDASNAACARELDRLAGLGPDVSLVRLPQNLGKGGAVSAGLRAAQHGAAAITDSIGMPGRVPYETHPDRGRGPEAIGQGIARLVEYQLAQRAGSGGHRQRQLDAVRRPHRPVDEPQVDDAEPDFRINDALQGVEYLRVERAGRIRCPAHGRILSPGRVRLP